MENEFSTRAAEVIRRCETLARFSETPKGTLRTFLCAAMRDCHREVTSWLERCGVNVKIDAAGNLRGVYAGTEPDAGRLLIGSHLDTVPNAGAYDGILGVVIAVSLLEGLRGKRLPFEIEVVGFSEEEGVRFGVPFIGSRALVGRLDEALLARRDANGVSVRHAIEEFGLKLEEIPAAQIGSDVLGFVEFHIEQGPVLEERGQALGVVEAIAGQTRMEFRFAGRAGHAGTTPMNLRHDALAGAVEWIGAVEREAHETAGLVATVGSVKAEPGAVNVIAGEARASLDVRHASDVVRIASVEKLTLRAEEIALRRGLTVEWKTLMDQKAVAMDPMFVREMEEAIRATGREALRMVSGAGHDAMILAERVPSAMIFLRSPGGISHNPAETVHVDDVAAALECGAALLEQLATKKNVSTKMSRA